MSDIRETGSLEEQLRQDQRREAARRRRKRLPWMIPLALLAVLIGVGLYLLISNQNPKTPRTAETEAPANSPVTIAFVGDIAMTKAAQEAFRTPAGYDFSPCFRWVTAELRAADLAVGNLEGNISDEISDYNYPPALLTALYDAGFDVLQTANSFSVVNGVSGLARTKAAISSAGLRSVGTSATKEEADQTGGVLVQDVNGIRFAFLAFTKGMENNLRVPEEALWSVNLLYTDELYKEIARDAILNAVKRARAENPDVIVALVHWGSEYDEELSDSQTKIAELLLENGVSLVVGSHSHYVGPVRRTNGYGVFTGSAVVAYSLGDFLSAADATNARAGCILNVRFLRENGQVRMTDVSCTPTYSTQPSEALECEKWEILDSRQAMAFYEERYYDAVSAPMYELLKQTTERMQTQIGTQVSLK